MKKEIFSLALWSAAVVMSLGGCKDKEVEMITPTLKKPVESVEITPISGLLTVGDVLTLKAIVLPANATNQNVIWKTIDAKIAIVEAGKVTAMSEGSVVIKATTEDGGFTDSCTIEVSKNSVLNDIYTIGKTDFSSGWWADFSKDYVIPNGEKWCAQFKLNINPQASNTYKNFALIITSDAHRGEEGYREYGAIRFDHQPTGNSE